MLLKIAAIAMLVLAGWLFAPAQCADLRRLSMRGLPSFAWLAALTPVMFAYGGWQTASFVAGEMRDPSRDLSRALLLGVAGVGFALHRGRLGLRRRLGALKDWRTPPRPAADVMRLALGDTGATLIALGIAISALGFLSQGMLTAPRVYFAMAEDGLFFPSVAQGQPAHARSGRCHPCCRVRWRRRSRCPAATARS